MSTEYTGDMGYQHGGGGHGILNCPSSRMDTNSMSDKVAGMAMCSESMFKSSTAAEPFYASGWDPLVSLNHVENFGGSSVVPHHHEFGNSVHFPGGLENQAISSSSHLVHYPSDSNLVDMVPKMSCFGSGTFSEMVNSFGLPDCGKITETSFHPKYDQKKDVVAAQEDCQISEGRALGNGKKKRKASDSHSPLNPKKNVEGEQQKDLSGNSSECSKEQDEMKHKMEQSNSTNLRSKQASKQVKDNSNSGEPSKETYIHVRAKRGQATNSHSLAERVRRERISERMRLLQELVPGCNKITGKAVMLDEIINYVQSLQQQVEFLSMKLATVNPELNIDLERIFSKDILHSRSSNAATLGIGPGLNSPHHFPGYPQGSFQGIPGATAPFHPLPQTIWDNELQSILQMGFDSNPSINNLGPNGRSKLEL